MKKNMLSRVLTLALAALLGPVSLRLRQKKR